MKQKGSPFAGLPQATARQVRRDFLLVWLRRGGKLRVGKAFAHSLGLTRKELVAAIDALIDAGEPVSWRGARWAVYDVNRKSHLLELSEEELVTVIAALRQVQNGAHTRSMLIEAVQILFRIGSMLPTQSFDKLRYLGQFEIADGRLDPGVVAPSPPHLLIDSAMQAETKLKFLYVDSAGARTERTVWPIAFTHHDSCVVAWCESRDDFRTFRITNMVALVQTNEGMPRRRSALRAAWRKHLPAQTQD